VLRLRRLELISVSKNIERKAFVASAFLS